MKRSVNFNGFSARHRRIGAADLVATLRALGMTDDEIRAALAERQVTKQTSELESTGESDAGKDAEP